MGPFCLLSGLFSNLSSDNSGARNACATNQSHGEQSKPQRLEFLSGCLRQSDDREYSVQDWTKVPRPLR